MNRVGSCCAGPYDWYTAATGWRARYPGDSAILAPDQVPGAGLAAGYLGDG